MCAGIKISWSASVVGFICWLYYGLTFPDGPHGKILAMLYTSMFIVGCHDLHLAKVEQLLDKW